MMRHLHSNFLKLHSSATCSMLIHYYMPIQELLASGYVPERQQAIPREYGAVLTLQEFLADFSLEAKTSKTIFATTMQFDSGLVTNQLLEAFRKAPEGAHKRVVYDAFSTMVSGDFILEAYVHLPGVSKKAKKRISAQEQMKTDFEDAGVAVDIINQPKSPLHKLFPFVGRSHLKLSYIVKDDGQAVAYAHSFNFHDNEFTDQAVKFTGDNAQKIIDVYRAIVDQPPQQDFAQQLSSNLWIYVDSGHPGKSTILEKATQLVEHAKQQILLATFMTPDGKFAASLDHAQGNGINLDILLTKWYLIRPLMSDNNAYALADNLARSVDKLLRTQLPATRMPYTTVHSKLLLIDPFTDQPQALFGSHNYAGAGVIAGTSEVQLLSTDPVIVGNFARRFFDYRTAAMQIS